MKTAADDSTGDGASLSTNGNPIRRVTILWCLSSRVSRFEANANGNFTPLLRIRKGKKCEWRQLQIYDHKTFSWTNTKLKRIIPFKAHLVSCACLWLWNNQFTKGMFYSTSRERFCVWGFVKYFNKGEVRKKEEKKTETRLQSTRTTRSHIKEAHLRAKHEDRNRTMLSFALFADILHICSLFIGVIKVLIRIILSDGC